MILVDPVHSLPELVNQIMVSCGIGLAGIVGAKATEEVRALTAGEQRADYMDALGMDIDSFCRRRELAEAAGDRDWNDVSVDKFSNIIVVSEAVPELESHDDLQAFDQLLKESPAAKRRLREEGRMGVRENDRDLLPKASEFVFEEED